MKRIEYVIQKKSVDGWIQEGEPYPEKHKLFAVDRLKFLKTRGGNFQLFERTIIEKRVK